MNSPPRTHRRAIIGHHLVLHAYGQWLPNDPRGSGSQHVKHSELGDLGAVHCGRKRVQPSREELRRFYRDAELRLEFAPVWFDHAKRQAVADAFTRTIALSRYTVWACAILPNHAHLCVRRHRDDAITMWRTLANTSREQLRLFADVSSNHPVWSDRPYNTDGD